MNELDDFLNAFKDNAGVMPQVNPPEAAKVLAEQTAPEVAGHDEPEAKALATPAPTAKPPEVDAPKPKRARKAKPAAPAAAASSVGEMTVASLCAQLQALGFEPTLRWVGRK